ncbi:hypothetical protein [Mycoplasma anserisalpingitidis]|uniref:hypothetical protein n=1 Tax=Mycoplasma anserisalpingitidis TaxID=519450 RepID=UPI001CF684F5|nr:hypothetical protein [Mycoplasma anserisalpingitidis]UCU26606.1 hypothetical protein K7D06_03345 [Mycoplasma anserisalpingitidis]UCU27444.1 hypothetical protein K9O38_00135 [Mycoplasma anserisalpingitidis]
MKNNKKLVILSSSLGGLTLAAGALAVSCNNESKTTQEDLELEKSSSSIVVKNGLSLQHRSSLTTNDFEVKSTSNKNEIFVYEIKNVVPSGDFKVNVIAEIRAKNNNELTPVVLTQEFDVNEIVPEMFLKAKNELREALQKATIETVYVGETEKADLYLPSLSSVELKKLFELNGKPTNKTTNKVIEAVEASIQGVKAKNDTAEISVLLRSLVQPDVFAEITVLHPGFKNETQYNEELEAKKAEIVASEKARLEELAKTLKVTTVEGFKKSLTLASDAQVGNFLVLFDENANATAEVTKVTGDNNAAKVTVEVTLKSKVEGAEPLVVSVDVLGFKEFSKEALETSNTLQELVSQLKLVHAELTEANGTAEKAEKLLNGDKANYQTVLKVNTDVLPEGVTFEVVSVRTTTQHPETLLVTYAISKDGVSVSKEVLVSGYNFESKKDETVDTNAEIQKVLDKMAASAEAQFKDDTVYVNKNLANLKNKKWYLASQYAEEFNNEKALKDFDLAKSILALTFKDSKEANAQVVTPENGKFAVKDVVVKQSTDGKDEGIVKLSVTIESTDPRVDKTKSVPSRTFNVEIKGFMGQKHVDSLQQALRRVLNAASVKNDANNKGLKFEINKINRIPSTPVSIFEGSQASEYYKYFEAINGFVTTGLDGKPTDLTPEIIVNEIQKVEYFKGYPIQTSDVKLEELTTDVKVTIKETGTVNAIGKVSVKLPGMDRINADDSRTNIVDGFLSDAKFEELKTNWYKTAVNFISANIQSGDAIVIYDRDGKYFSNEKSKSTIIEALNHIDNIVFQSMDDGAFLPKEKVFSDNSKQAIENKLGDVALQENEQSVRDRHTAKNPEDQIYAVKLKVLSAKKSETDTKSISIKYTLVSPYFSDWTLETLDLTQNFEINGFVSIEEYRKDVLAELKTLIDDQNNKKKPIVEVDYSGKATTSVDAAIKKTGDKFDNLTKVSYKFVDGLDINKLVDTDSILYNIDLSKFSFKPTALASNVANSSTVDGRDGKVDVTVELSTTIGSEYGIKTVDKIELTTATVEGFLATAVAEKARLNALKAQFAYKGIVSVLLDKNAKRDEKIKELEESGDFDSATALRKLGEINIKDVALNTTDFKAIATYGSNLSDKSANAAVVIDTTLSEKTDGNIKFNFKFTSTLQPNVSSDAKAFTFGTFARTSADAAQGLSKDEQERKDSYEKTIASFTASYKLKADADKTKQYFIGKVTPKDVLNYIKPSNVLDLAKRDELFGLSKLSTELETKANLSVEFKEFEDKVNQNNNDKIVVTYKITDKLNPKIVVSKEVIVQGFLTEIAKEQKALEELTKNLKEATWKPVTEKMNNFLPSIFLNAKMFENGKESFIDQFNKQKDSTEQTLAEKITDLEKVFVVTNLDTSKAKISSFIKSIEADDKNGALKVKIDLSSARKGFENVTVEKELSIKGLLTTETYKAAYEKEVAKLNQYATDNKFSFRFDSTKVQATADDLVGIKSDKNPYWEKFVLVSKDSTEVSSDDLAAKNIKLVVEAVEFGVKSTDVYVTYRLVSSDKTKAYSELDEVYTGAQSSLIKTSVLTTNLITPEEKESASGLRRVETEQYLTTTNNIWNDSLKSLQIKSYNKVFSLVNEAQFVDKLYSNNSSYELNNGKMVVFAGDKEVKDKSSVLASEVTGLKLVNSADYLKFGGLELVTSDTQVLSTNDNSGVVEVAFRVSSIEFPEIVSPVLYAKISGFKTKAVEIDDKKKAEQEKIYNWTLASKIAKTGNIITKDIVNKKGEKEIITYDEILSGNADSKLQFYLPGANASTSDKNGAWTTANMGKAFDINVLGKDKYEKEALELKATELFVAKDNVHFEQELLSANQYINVVVKNRVDVNGDILVTYAVQLLSYNEETKEFTQLAEVENRSLLTQLPTEAELAYRKEFLSALAKAEGSFISPKASEMTAEEFVKAYNAAKEEEKAGLLQSAVLYNNNGSVSASDLKVVVESVELDSKHVGRVLVTYHVSSAKTTGEYSKDEYVKLGENVKTKHSSVLGFLYNKEHASVATIDNAQPIAPATNTSN